MSVTLSLNISLLATHELVNSTSNRDCLSSAPNFPYTAMKNLKDNNYNSTHHDQNIVIDIPTFQGQEFQNNQIKLLTPLGWLENELGHAAKNQHLLIQMIIAQNVTCTTAIDYPEVTLTVEPKPSESIYFCQSTSQFFIDGQPISPAYLTDTEHRLLKYFYENINCVCSYHHIAKNVWHGWVEDNTITQRVYLLRKKLKKITSGASNLSIKTCRGYVRGYMLTKHGENKKTD